MTSGVTGSLPTAAMSLNPTKYRNWNGVNGKYETVGGRKRDKWNNYTCLATATEPKANRVEILCHYPVPPYAPNTPVVYTEVPQWDPSFTLSGATNVTTNQQLAVLNKLLGKIKGHTFNLGVEAGQASQTIGLLSGNLRKLGGAALALRRGDFATAARQLGTRPKTTRLKAKDVSGRWLELQYGWLPLLSSSFEAAKAFEAISAGPRKKIFRAVVKGDREVNLSSSANFSAKTSVLVGRRLQYEMYEELSVVRQLGLEDPLSVAWELTPWSFVIDWFIPFGTYLSNLNQIPKLKGRWLITDFLKKDWTEVEFQWLPAKVQGVRIIDAIQKSPRASFKVTHTKRTYSASPPPVPIPGFNFLGLSPTRFFNALSLAHQRFLK